MAANINRVVLVGNLTKIPSCATRRAARRSAASASPSTAGASDESGQLGRQAELLQHLRLRQPGRELRAVPGKGRPVAIDGRLDWREWEAKDGAQARVRRDRRRQRPVPRQPRRRRGGGGGNQFVPAGASEAAPTSRPQPTTTSPSRRAHGQREEHSTQRKRPGGPAGAIRRRNCFFCKEKIAEIDYKNITQLRRYISERGRSAAAASPARAGATRCRSRRP